MLGAPNEGLNQLTICEAVRLEILFPSRHLQRGEQHTREKMRADRDHTFNLHELHVCTSSLPAVEVYQLCIQAVCSPSRDYLALLEGFLFNKCKGVSCQARAFALETQNPASTRPSSDSLFCLTEEMAIQVMLIHGCIATQARIPVPNLCFFLGGCFTS